MTSIFDMTPDELQELGHQLGIEDVTSTCTTSVGSWGIGSAEVNRGIRPYFHPNPWTPFSITDGVSDLDPFGRKNYFHCKYCHSLTVINDGTCLHCGAPL